MGRVPVALAPGLMGPCPTATSHFRGGDSERARCSGAVFNAGGRSFRTRAVFWRGVQCGRGARCSVQAQPAVLSAGAVGGVPYVRGVRHGHGARCSVREGAHSERARCSGAVFSAGAVRGVQYRRAVLPFTQEHQSRETPRNEYEWLGTHTREGAVFCLWRALPTNEGTALLLTAIAP